MVAMTIPPTSYRFYGDLARWWPLISPPEDYAEEAAFATSLLSPAAPNLAVLELGSGGGHNAVHLKEHFAMTLVDLSEAMLDVSRRLNPECVHRQGDMRTIRLGRQFDAVFIHDAIDYMAEEADLRLAMETAFIHCRPGGLALFMPDDISETFEEGTDHGGNDDADGNGVRYLEWDWDPDPSDTWKLTEYAFLLREVDGSIQVVHETHRTGLFSRGAWVRLLSEVGFEPETVTEVTTEDRTPRELFIGRRPPGPVTGEVWQVPPTYQRKGPPPQPDRESCR
jgi:SAM-dependent methyltransferase